jgi:hypothetical protein
MQDSVDGAQFDDRGECLIKVDPLLLLEAVDYPSSFATFQGSIRVELVLEQPLAGDDVDARRSRNECPCGVILEGLNQLGLRRAACTEDGAGSAVATTLFA